MVQVFDAKAVADATPFPALVDALERTFRNPPTTPPRQHYDIDSSAPGRVTLLDMPAWQADSFMGVKLVSVVPENSARDLPTVDGFYVMFDARSGKPLALMDAPELTARRTAAASALASRYLSRADSKSLLVVGTGKLAAYMAAAHCAVRAFEKVSIWGRNPDKAEAIVRTLEDMGIAATVAADLEAAARQADVISCVTSSRAPVVKGAWLQDGAHLDLVGAYRKDMRETDDTAVTKARIYVDTFENALREAGDILIPMTEGVIERADIKADLFGLTGGENPGRQADDAITLFKSVGASLEDFSAASLVLKSKGYDY